jgi:hypothetical protein
MIALVYVEVVSGKGSSQHEVPATVMFHKADLPRPAGLAGRAFFRNRILLHRGSLPGKPNYGEVEAHAAQSTGPPVPR